MNLARAEFRRLFKRRFTRYMLLIGILLLGAVAVGTFLTNQKVTPAAVAAAERAADEEYRNLVADVDRERQACERAKQPGGTDSDRFPQSCEELVPPPRDAISSEWHMPPTFEFRKEFGETIVVLAGVLALVGFVVGASFVGAEWSTGGMMNLLLWRPRRLQVLGTKLGVLLGSMAGISTALAVLWTAAFWAIGSYRGTTMNMTPGAWTSFAITGARALALILAVCAVGFALASLGRHTAMALGVAIGVGVVGQTGLSIALAMAQVRFLEAWLLPTYAYAWLAKKVTLSDYQSCEFTAGACEPRTIDITWQHGGLVLGLGTLVLVVLAGWTMRRRDIT